MASTTRDRELLESIVCGRVVDVFGPIGPPTLSDLLNSRKLFKALHWSEGFKHLLPSERKARLNQFLDENPAIEDWFTAEVNKNGTRGLDILSVALREFE